MFGCTKVNIEILKSQNDFNLVLMDMMMPEMDGYQATKLIRNIEEIKHLPIIAVTAQAMPEDRQKCLEAGAQDYVSKPIDVDVLIKAMEKLL
ncbi:response regulator [Chryseobacterium sp. POL2]|uniref:response regulator n=1 Tax=Chryseobacterium sp. POL2 TaxID=2713414 RepID=UPI001E64F153|nr:response regulator [Chryseobacterium sp. POL2]